MRSILRAAARGARGLLWVVKGLLLVVAVGVLVLWPMSRGRELGVGVERHVVRDQRVDEPALSARCDTGRIAVGRAVWHYLGSADQEAARSRLAVLGPGWRWIHWSHATTGWESGWPSAWGPFRWWVIHKGYGNLAFDGLHFSAPCWLVALAAGAWPVTSLGLLIRRRRRRRRREQTGCCPRCGYDCRATADPAGPRLARCPECGAAVPPAAAPG
jgi:hypothetical protein